MWEQIQCFVCQSVAYLFPPYFHWSGLLLIWEVCSECQDKGSSCLSSHITHTKAPGFSLFVSQSGGSGLAVGQETPLGWHEASAGHQWDRLGPDSPAFCSFSDPITEPQLLHLGKGIKKKENEQTNKPTKKRCLACFLRKVVKKVIWKLMWMVKTTQEKEKFIRK